MLVRLLTRVTHRHKQQNVKHKQLVNKLKLNVKQLWLKCVRCKLMLSSGHESFSLLLSKAKHKLHKLHELRRWHNRVLCGRLLNKRLLQLWRFSSNSCNQQCNAKYLQLLLVKKYAVGLVPLKHFVLV